MSSQELIKFLTRALVEYVDTPAAERKKQKQMRKIQRGEWHVHWFGLVPAALTMMLRPMVHLLGKMPPLNKWLRA
ncbi:hypothetical protein GCM10010965_10600 [Caldalkalibacillus thermarum]|uniref:YqzE family protein n=1 Tax=Caldalkalibacillus thermarum TaxID=296745 RepID=UPI00166D8F17|nr:YqzE family protein [Caldalkalibacillus thermarum]GGK19403.1 hypothetical protein GCM10010965_10600 [Caldalkalibacillus thermarum]